MNIFKKIKNAFTKRSQVEVEVLQGIDIEHMYTSPEVAETIRGKVQLAIQKKDEITPKYEALVTQLALVQKIEDLPKDDLRELENIAKIYSETILEKETFKNVLKNQNSHGDYLEKYKDDIDTAIQQMEEHEKDLSIIKNDLYHLEGEKAEISFKNSRALKALSIIKIILLTTIILTSVATLILTTLFFVYNTDVFLPSLIVIVTVSFIGLWLFAFRRYLIFELKRNQKLQKREVKLTNKIKIKFVNVQQFLDYEYKKYQVNSSEMLKIRWENYQKNAKNEAKYKRISSNIASLIQDLDRLLLRNNVDGDTFVSDHIDYFTSKKGRKMLEAAIELEKDDIKLQFDQCENEIYILSKLLEQIMDK